MADDDYRWTLRGVPKAYAEQAAKAAGRLDLTLGAYVCQALDLRAQAEREPFDLVVARPAADKTADTADAAELRDLMVAASAAAEASGQSMSKRAAQRFYGLIDDRVRAAGGLPPRRKRQMALRIGAIAPQSNGADAHE